MNRSVEVTRLLGGLGGFLWVGLGVADFCLEAGRCGGEPFVLLEIAALLALLAGTGGFHLRFREAYGRPGTVASGLVALGLVGSLATVVVGWRAGTLSLVWSGAYPVLVVGWTLLGAVLLRRGVGSRPGALLLVLALPLGLVGAYLSLFVLVPAFDLVVDEHVLSSGPVILYGIAWILESRSM